MREKLTFEPNVPVVATLEYDDGKVVEGRFGDQYQYFLAGERILYADPDLRERIKRSGAKTGDTIAICKRATRSGNKRRVNWEVVLQAEEPYGASDEDLPAQMWPHQRGDTAHADRGPRPVATAARQAAPRSSGVDVHASASAQTAPRQASLPDVAAADYTAALRAAIEAARAAEAYAHAHGYPLRFASAEIQAMAATIFIRTKGDR